jgi:hypothetical protein
VVSLINIGFPQDLPSELNLCAPVILRSLCHRPCLRIAPNILQKASRITSVLSTFPSSRNPPGLFFLNSSTRTITCSELLSQLGLPRETGRPLCYPSTSYVPLKPFLVVDRVLPTVSHPHNTSTSLHLSPHCRFRPHLPSPVSTLNSIRLRRIYLVLFFLAGFSSYVRSTKQYDEIFR